MSKKNRTDEFLQELVLSVKNDETLASKVINNLNFLDRRFEIECYRKDKFRQYLLWDDVRDDVCYQPESNCIGNERKAEISELLHNIKKHVGQAAFDILVMYHAQGLSMDDIAQRLGTYKMNISRKIKKATSALNKISNLKEQVLEVLEKPVVQMLPITFNGRMMPYEIQMEKSQGGHWWKNIYKTKETKCQLPQYLQNCFSDNLAVCSMCMKEKWEYGKLTDIINKCSELNFFEPSVTKPAS